VYSLQGRKESLGHGKEKGDVNCQGRASQFEIDAVANCLHRLYDRLQYAQERRAMEVQPVGNLSFWHNTRGCRTVAGPAASHVPPVSTRRIVSTDVSVVDDPATSILARRKESHA
jgi:hypothetical protein